MLNRAGTGIQNLWGQLRIAATAGLNALAIANTSAGAALTVGPNGNVSVGAPLSGASLSVGALTGNALLTGSSTGAASSVTLGWNIGIGSGWNFYTASTDTMFVGTVGTGNLELATAGAGRIGIGSAGNVSINAPTSGITLTTTGPSGNWAELALGSGTTGNSFGLLVQAGTNASDSALAVTNQSSSTTYLRVQGDGSSSIGPVAGTHGLGISSAGGVTVYAPTSGTTLSVVGETTNSVLALSSTGNTTNGSFSINFDSTGAAYLYNNISTSTLIGNIGSGPLDLVTSNVTRVQINGSGNVTVEAPSSGTALGVNGASTGTNPAVLIQGNSAAGGRGLSVYSGTAAGDYPLIVGNAAATKNYFLIEGDGSSYLGPNAGTTGLAVSATGLVSVNTPTSGASLSVGALTGNALLTGSSTGAASSVTLGWNIGIGSGWNFCTASTDTMFLGTIGTGNLTLCTAGGGRINVNSAGNVTISPPTSGVGLTVNGSGQVATFIGAANSNPYIDISDGTRNGYVQMVSSGNLRVGSSSTSYGVELAANGAPYLVVGGAGNVTISPPSSGVALTVNGVSGTHSTQIADSAATLYNAGFLEVPVTTKSANYGFVLADSGKCFEPSAAGVTFTIPANASVAYPVGTVLMIETDANGCTLAITTDTLNWRQGGTNSTGTRTIAAYSVVTMVKRTSTSWFLSGNGIS